MTYGIITVTYKHIDYNLNYSYVRLGGWYKYWLTVETIEIVLCKETIKIRLN
jgi:hypothetical protein